MAADSLFWFTIVSYFFTILVSISQIYQFVETKHLERQIAAQEGQRKAQEKQVDALEKQYQELKRQADAIEEQNRITLKGHSESAEYQRKEEEKQRLLHKPKIGVGPGFATMV